MTRLEWGSKEHVARIREMETPRPELSSPQTGSLDEGGRMSYTYDSTQDRCDDETAVKERISMQVHWHHDVMPGGAPGAPALAPNSGTLPVSQVD